MSPKPCKSCGKRGSDPATTAAYDRLDEMYSTDRRVKNGICPLDGSKAIVTFLRFKGKRVAYRKCRDGHVLRL